jgi:GTPase SAR1 family protein
MQMNYDIGSGWFNDLARVDTVRHEIAARLDSIAHTLSQAESEGEKTSGRFGLEPEIKRLLSEAENLRQGVFRLLVLGDMKRGKSTFLNALLGQNLLPSDVSPCTALLTTIKYGAQEKVTIYYNDGKAPEQIDFQQFKLRYTIDPNETKVLEKGEQLAFPDVSHAVIEHPLPLLGKGIEFVDSPGLNDTEARNELSLNYIYNCHAILFVLSASQPCTLEERRYLQNYLRDKGLNIFFIVNGWDRVKDGLVNPDDVEALQLAEERLRTCFRSNLAEYCNHNNKDIYQQRVFEVSALNALRARIKNPNADLDGTGLPPFLNSLNRFLAKERAVAEVERTRTIANQVYNRFCEVIDRRVPLLDNSVDELKQKINSIQSDFEKLSDVSNRFQLEIRDIRDTKAKDIADSFRNYILNLETTFEEDFIASQPDLDYMQFFDKNNRAVFYTSFKRAFERYMNDRITAWEFISKQELAVVFTQLEEKAASYRAEYGQILEAINCKLIGYRFYAVGHTYRSNQFETWADTVMDVFGAIPDSMNRGINSFNYFWVRVFAIVAASLILQFAAILFAGITLPVLGAILGGIGVVALQAEYVRRTLINATRKEFAKHLPQIAEEQWRPIFEGVQQCFNDYANLIGTRINSDINSRKQELDNLLKQKQSHEIDIKAEAKRLKDLEIEIQSQIKQIDLVRESL